MADYDIRCGDCGHEFVSTRKNTKYCSICRLVRDIPYVVGATRKCSLCDAVYAPLDIRDRLCGTCAPRSQHDEITCALCHLEDQPRVRKDIAVCKVCARNPKHRKRFWKALLVKQQSRKEAVPA